MRYGFKRVDESDLPLINAWITHPHVARWWDSDAFTAADLEDTRVSLWLVCSDEHPFAFIQDYAVHGWPDHHFGYLPEGARGIDQFIGVEAMLGRGHGPAFIRAHLGRLFDAGVPVVGTDPHPDNIRAIRAYRKAGFRITGRAQATDWGLALRMECRPGDG